MPTYSIGNPVMNVIVANSLEDCAIIYPNFEARELDLTNSNHVAVVIGSTYDAETDTYSPPVPPVLE